MNIDNKTDKKITLVNYGYDRETIVLGEEILSVGRPIICFDEENTDEKITDEEGTNDGDSNYKSKKGKWQPIKLSAKECLDDKHTFAKQTSSQVQKQIEHAQATDVQLDTDYYKFDLSVEYDEGQYYLKGCKLTNVYYEFDENSVLNGELTLVIQYDDAKIDTM